MIFSDAFSRELVPIALAISLPLSTTMDDYMQMSFIPSFPIALIPRDAMNYLIRDPSVVSYHGFRKFFKLLFVLSEFPVTYCFWPFSPACVMVKSICLAAFIKILSDFPVILLILPLCEYTQSSVDTHKLSFWLIRPFKQSWFSTNQLWLALHSSPFNLLVFDQSICLWYTNLEILIPLVVKYRYFSDVL